MSWYRLPITCLTVSALCLAQSANAPSGSATGNSSISGRGGSSDAFGTSGSEYRRPVFIQGKVLLEDGSPAPVDAVVELHCVGQPNREEGVHTNGSFSFQFTAVNPESITGPRRFGIDFAVYVSCEIQALLNGYYSPRQVVAGNDPAGNFDAGTLRLYKKAGVKGMTVSATNLQAPKQARKAFKKGMNLAAKKKWKSARGEFEKATAAYPDYAVAWYELGRVDQIQNNRSAARECFEKALAADPKFLPPSLRLALLDFQESHWRQVADRTADILDKNPYDFPEAYFYGALANYQLNNLARAEKTARQGLSQHAEQRCPQILHALGMVLAAQGRLEEAIGEYERFFKIAPNHPDRPAAEQQLAIIRKNL